MPLRKMEDLLLISNHDFKWMCELDKQKGVDIGNTYLNALYGIQFLVSIAEVTREKIEEDLQRAKFISIRADDSTDVSSSENEVVYIHFSVQGVVQCYFGRFDGM